MSVQIFSLNYSAHVWSPASWGDLDGLQGLLGVGAPSRTPKPDFSPARHTCAHAHERAPPVARPKRNGRRHAAGGPGPAVPCQRKAAAQRVGRRAWGAAAEPAGPAAEPGESAEPGNGALSREWASN
jgi:hypothetical protein